MIAKINSSSDIVIPCAFEENSYLKIMGTSDEFNLALYGANIINENKIRIYPTKNYIAKKEYNKIYIEQNKEQEKKYKYILNDKLIINDIIIKKVDKEEKDDNTICRLNSKDIKFPLYVRNRIDGDYIILKGLNKKKKVKDIKIEKKITKKLKNVWLILMQN